jgi:hypothetical protein
MKKKIFKSILLATSGLLVILSTVLAVHIYKVTRPAKADATTVSMARIDFKQDISDEDAQKITNWFNTKKGIQQFKCSAENRNAVFTFYPTQLDATKTVEIFTQELHYNAVRFMPNKADMMKGCPVAVK